MANFLITSPNTTTEGSSSNDTFEVKTAAVLGATVRGNDGNDLITALEWLLDNRTPTNTDKNNIKDIENENSNLFNFSMENISGYIGKFLQMPADAYNEIIKKIENKVSDYSTSIIEHKIGNSLTITTHHEILNYQISSRAISYFRALWPSVSLLILFYINGLLN